MLKIEKAVLGFPIAYLWEPLTVWCVVFVYPLTCRGTLCGYNENKIIPDDFQNLNSLKTKFSS